MSVVGNLHSSKPSCIYLLRCLPVPEYLFESNVELAHIVLAEAVFVPADSLKQHTLYACDGQVESLVPFRIECLWYNRSSFPRIAKCQNKVL